MVGAVCASVSCGEARVAIVDIDAHHGNGTEEIVDAEVAAGNRGIFFCSIQGADIFPWTAVTLAGGKVTERDKKFGCKDKCPGNTIVVERQGVLNVFLPTPEKIAMAAEPVENGQIESTGEAPRASSKANSTGGADVADTVADSDGEPDPDLLSAFWRREFQERILPALQKFRPTIILISAGFDGHRDDPLAGETLGLEHKDYAWATDQCARICPKIVAVLEGGYSDTALAPSACSCVAALVSSGATAVARV
jgi:acetoin utilization deacetylase AcuC-like enzyme